MRNRRSVLKTGLSFVNLRLTLALGALTLAVCVKEILTLPVVIKRTNVGQGAPASATWQGAGNRFDALPVPRSVRGSLQPIEVNGTRQNDKRDGDDIEMSLFKRQDDRGANAGSLPFSSARIPESRKLDFDPSPLQPNEIHAKRYDEENIPLNSELDLSNDYGQDNDRSSGDTDYIYFVRQHQRPAQKELPRPTPTPASVTVLLATEEEVEEEKVTSETQISDLSQGDFNSSKATFSSPPTSPERVNLIPDSTESQTADLAQTKEVTEPARDDASEGSQIPFNTSVLQQQEQDEREVSQLEPPTVLTAINESSDGDPITGQPSKNDLADLFKEGENKRSPLLTLLNYKESRYAYRGASTMAGIQRPQQNRVTILQQQYHLARNQSSVSWPQDDVNVKGDRSDIDDDSKSAVSFHQITKEACTRKPVDSITVTVLQLGFVLFSMLTLAAAVISNLNNRTTRRTNGLRVADDISSYRYPVFELPDQLNRDHTLASRWSSPLHSITAGRGRKPLFHFSDEAFSDEGD